MERKNILCAVVICVRDYSGKPAVTLLGVRGLAAKSPTCQQAGNALQKGSRFQNIVFIAISPNYASSV